MKGFRMILWVGCFLMGMNSMQANPLPEENNVVRPLAVEEPVGEVIAETELDAVPYGNMRQLMRRYRWKSGVIGFSMGRLGLSILRTFIDEPAAKQVLRDMRKVNFLIVKRDAVQTRLLDNLQADYELQKRGYDSLLEVNSEGDKVSVIGILSPDKEKIKELVFYVSEDSGDVVMMDLIGRMDTKDLMNLLEEAMK